MLLGLAGVAIPIVVHLLHRRRFDVVDWGAMQFLQVSTRTRRRLLVEELLLLLLRMALVALLVLALADPYSNYPLLARFDQHSSRDIVLLLDGSASMGYQGDGKTPSEAAREWATSYLGELGASDRVAILQAGQHVTPGVSEPTQDLDRARKAIAQLPPPVGGCDWPQAVQAACRILANSRRPQREIIVLSDGQRMGWADETSLLHWEALARFRDPQSEDVRVRVLNFDPQRPADPPNWSLAPLRSSRAVASVGQQITFRTALEVRGQEGYRPPYRLRVEVDGRPASALNAPAAAGLEKGQLPLSFTHRFTAPGSHLVSVSVEPDPPPEQRPSGYRIKDRVPGDNRRDLALEVLPALPVLLVDGDSQPAPRERGADFLRDALAPARDPAPVVLARVVGIREFDPALLTSDLGKEPGTKPRVLVLSNVPRLSARQRDATTIFLANGGGLLVTLGARVEARSYNEQLYDDGQGWLPGHLEEIAGDPNKPDLAASPLPTGFFHPALELFREGTAGGLEAARFPQWYRVSTGGRDAATVPVALLTSGDPLLLERSGHAGRVLLCTVPLDNSWGTNLPELPAFAPLVHELLFYLAGARAADNNLQPGQPLRYTLGRDEPFTGLSLQTPTGQTRSLTVDASASSGSSGSPRALPGQSPMVVYEDTHETGVYRLTTGDGRTVYYVAQPDPRESDLAPCSEADRERVREYVPLTYEGDPQHLSSIEPDPGVRLELWWWLLAGVGLILLGELWLTRRIILARR
jgi:hypothetical protein